jgi:uncharacterized protein (TIGR03437 family)
MKRIKLLTTLALLGCASAGAQTSSSITIGTSFTSLSGANPIFIVDGTTYTTRQSFVWPAGSKHTIQFPFTTDNSGNTLNYQSGAYDTVRYTFGGWQPNAGFTFPGMGSSILTISADPSLTSLIATVNATYRVHVNLPNPGPDGSQTCGGAPTDPAAANRQGIIYLDAACYAQSTDFTTDPFLAAGTHTLTAFPYPGWVFYGWALGNNPPQFVSSFTVPGPNTVTALFSIAKRVNFVTNPPGLQILVDGALVNTVTASDGVSCVPDTSRIPVGAPAGYVPLCSGQFDFLPGSKHTIGSPDNQLDKAGKYWVFHQFSTGAGQNSVYVTPTTTNVADTITVNYVPGVRVSVPTNPAHMKVMIDGRDNWLAYNFIWGSGDTHHIAAETPQTDSHGRVYAFSGWSDTGMADTGHDIVVGTTDTAITANYTVMPQVSLNTAPTALNFTVDGSACVSPCVLNKASGSTSQVAAPTRVSAGTGARYDFVSWSDGNTSATRAITFNQDTLSLTANYQMSYQFSGVINPAKAGAFQVTPASTDGFYANGTQITFTAAANGGFKFAHWEGDITGSYAPGVLTMTSPHTVQADFATVPYIPPAGIQSVTGPTPDGSVAPGSVISIYGQNLAPTLQIGPNNPLTQTLAGVTVTIGDYLLPLVFVSPTQIGAQVPWELAPGSYSLVVHNAGLPDVPGTVTITRDSPGVFTQVNDQQLPLILALHADGSLVNFSSPATIGEQITIYGTGFGPYNSQQVDGFPALNTATLTLTDPVAVNTDTASYTPDSVGAAPGMVGVNLLKLTIPGDMPASSNVNLTVQVNGKSSAQVVLPVQ